MRFSPTDQWELSMKHSSFSRLALAGFGLLSVVASPAAQAQYKCDQPRLMRVDATACALGAKDVASLRRYVTRTQSIYALQMKDYVRFEGDELKAPAPTAQVTRESVAAVAPATRSAVDTAQR